MGTKAGNVGRRKLLSIVAGASALLIIGTVRADSLETDLLIVGGNESACAAAVQAARLGVRRIALVNDITWLGGQFSSEGVGPADERTVIQGKSANFPRSGLFLEMIRSIRAYNSQTYGIPAPGNCWSATETIEPAAAEKLFERLLSPYLDGGSRQIALFCGWVPTRVACEGKRVTGVDFEQAATPGKTLSIRARLTIDASDWGDVIRLSGAGYYAGVDPKSRFGEPGAPEVMDGDAYQEMNPITWTATLRETDRDAVIAKPPRYDRRSYDGIGCAWADSDMPIGIYANDGSVCAYTQRRLVDRHHFALPFGTEKIQLNTTVQDYPLCQLPRPVADRLEAMEKGASRKNIAELSPAQRNVIFDDAKARTLGFLYYLQTELGADSAHFRRMELSDEFGTPDRLPPKPYVREGLRLKALYMLREQDIRSKTGDPQWAAFRSDDAAFGFQFHVDFHPTRRRYLNGAENGVWQAQHTPSRNWHTTTDRAMCPLRCLVPAEYDGLLGASKNIGVSSIVQAALRLHGQMMLVGQVAATLAWMSLRDDCAPRDVLASERSVQRLQTVLVRGVGGPGIAIWPWQDLDPDAPAFEAANLLSVSGLWPHTPDDLSFHPDEKVTGRELSDVLIRLCQRNKRDPSTTGDLSCPVVTWGALYTNLTANGFSASPSLAQPAVSRLPLSREELARHILRAVRSVDEVPSNAKQDGG